MHLPKNYTHKLFNSNLTKKNTLHILPIHYFFKFISFPPPVILLIDNNIDLVLKSKRSLLPLIEKYSFFWIEKSKSYNSLPRLIKPYHFLSSSPPFQTLFIRRDNSGLERLVNGHRELPHSSLLFHSLICMCFEISYKP